MLSEQTDAVIPPVRAGTIEHSIDVEYDHYQGGEGGFEATGEHAWEFDLTAYADLTGMDIGDDYPYVAQENGHTLRITTDYRWRHSTLHDVDNYTLGIETIAWRGTTSYDDIFWTMGGYYDLDEDLEVVKVAEEKQEYRIRDHYDEDVPHHSPHDVGRETFHSGEQFVYALHSGRLGPSPHDQLQRLIEADSPDEAQPVDAFEGNLQDSPAPADD